MMKKLQIPIDLLAVLKNKEFSTLPTFLHPPDFDIADATAAASVRQCDFARVMHHA
jgi:hypothetical protein